MADRNFKVKSGLNIPITSAAILTTDSSGNISSSSVLPITAGGTGQTSAGNALNALLPLQTGQTNKYLQTNGVTTQWNTVNVMSNVSISGNSNLSENTRYFVDTTAARTLTLPSSASVGSEIQIFDVSGSAFTNNITVQNNGLNIRGVNDTLIIDINFAATQLVYISAAYGWRVS